MSARSGALPRPSGRDGLPDDTGCSVLHVDMDAFFASVTLLRHPELQGTPVVIGGTGTRGVVLSATYEARAHGVRSAMPVSRARRLCPGATFLPPDHDDYARVSAGVMELFRTITPIVEPLSLDEAFLDVSGARRRLGSPVRIAQLLRDRVADEQGVPCSVGVAPTKMVAKLASTAAKPDGLLVVPRDGVLAFLHPLPVGALWGVGERTAEVLQRLGLQTVGELAHVPVETLRRALGPTAGPHLHALAWGRDQRPVVASEPERSTGAEETFGHDVDDPDVIVRELLRLSTRTAERLRATGTAGRTVVLKVRFADFTTITRSRTLKESTDVAQEVYSTARGLYEALGLQRARIRLVGVRVEGLVDVAVAPRQLVLEVRGGGRPTSWRDAERAADRAAARFGSGAVRPAALVRHDRGPGRG
ncbi:DNA polymerase-4 [Motilibacter rhizosphaerae]|uniref:DNA polymerase IV n=1 Tax=Motilibacter rhizosphaerae TaxID=598652 RepID=A0A4Q7NGI4_9ACTN|nr:DNA polymerase IV [Motilibacter rhizosphaerae]RZS82932.1 DNA polymerase-4 [Motilibacter rhizosphaerae]